MIKTIFTIIAGIFLSLVSCSVSDAEWIKCDTFAYTANEAPNLTASGEVPYYGGVACNFLPLGTHIIIDGKEFVVNDRSGTPGIIDIFMYSYEDAINYGVQYKDVFVVR